MPPTSSRPAMTRPPGLSDAGYICAIPLAAALLFPVEFPSPHLSCVVTEPVIEVSGLTKVYRVYRKDGHRRGDQQSGCQPVTFSVHHLLTPQFVQIGIHALVGIEHVVDVFFQRLPLAGFGQPPQNLLT